MTAVTICDTREKLQNCPFIAKKGKNLAKKGKYEPSRALDSVTICDHCDQRHPPRINRVARELSSLSSSSSKVRACEVSSASAAGDGRRGTPPPPRPVRPPPRINNASKASTDYDTQLEMDDDDI